jgi:hypothetical protein
MADYSSRTVTKTWVEYTLPNPTNWAEISKVMAAIDRVELPKHELRSSDDLVMVEGLDEEIVFRFEIPTPSTPSTPSTPDGAR